MPNVNFDRLGRRTGIGIVNQEAIQGSILPLPYIVWVKDKEIVIIGKRDLAPPVGELQEAVQGHREAQEVPENQWVREVHAVPVRIVIINTTITTVQANL